MTQSTKPLRQIIGQLANESATTLGVQAKVVGDWAGKMKRGDRGWPTHHAFLSASFDNSVNVAQSLYTALRAAQKIKS